MSKAYEYVVHRKKNMLLCVYLFVFKQGTVDAHLGFMRGYIPNFIHNLKMGIKTIKCHFYLLVNTECWQGCGRANTLRSMAILETGLGSFVHSYGVPTFHAENSPSERSLPQNHPDMCTNNLIAAWLGVNSWEAPNGPSQEDLQIMVCSNSIQFLKRKRTNYI